MDLFQKCFQFTQANEIRDAGLYPYFRPIATEQDTDVIIDGKRLLMLGSNSYLGLTNHPRVKEAAIAAIRKYGTGCAGSRFLNGTLDLHLQLEAELGEFLGKEAVLLYSTGFQANLGIISGLVEKGEYAVTDKSDHASILEGCKLSMGETKRFRHNDMGSLKRVLERLPMEVGKLIIVDGVYSMEGDIAPVPEIIDLARQYNARVMVDDAHGLGVLGERGAGTSEHFGVTQDVDIIMGTFSKSLASLGGFAASCREVVEYLKHHSRPLIFSASISPPNTAAALEALRILKEEPERREWLWRNTKILHDGFKSLGFDIGTSQTPVIPVYVGDVLKVFQTCMMLHQEGVFVNPVVPPGVPPGRSLIRVSCMATHTPGQMHFALEKFEKVGKALGLI
ncbi:MAG TPA: aminotransferase class I/II-fold pyridoxal phosphate-dependent enzyme [Thermosulfidibacter takaii]|uniref:Aminotransferase class I/II-fold pyridoxal phosphate-dependent enzyme n=1 Tax=Thermosulfidibacter takaii TaxID=412593 RepID=A0A7C0U6L7_9BACT|nr:aminotransferase class I/II-fold pyridoxal phosphate-dependent enzyme [Thermosulfidibacter takaii]